MIVFADQVVGASLQRSALALLRPPTTEQRLNEMLQDLAQLIGGPGSHHRHRSYGILQ